MRCPTCGGTMEDATKRRSPADRCSSCGGYWFERYAFGQCIVATGSDTDRQNVAQAVLRLEGSDTSETCPVCGDECLTETSFEEVGVLVCGRCHGLFVSEEALQEIIGIHKQRRRKETVEVLGEAATAVATKAIRGSILPIDFRRLTLVMTGASP